MGAILFIFFLIALYFLPSIIAISRDHSNRGAIEMTNLLLGWTLLGWIIAAIWSMTDNTKS